MKNHFPWYDSRWLRHYLEAKSIIGEIYPDKLKTFIEAFKPLETRKDFEVIKTPNILSQEIIEASKEFIKELKNEQKETHELFRFGRLVVHNHQFFNQIHASLTDKVSDLVNEEVEASYNFLSLYRSLGVCKVHMDSPEAKYTLDICIEQSTDWQIFISRRQDWVEGFEYTEQDWHEQIVNDPKNHFTAYSLEPGSGIIFSGSSQWHYRESIFQENNKNFCNLIFFHFFPKGMRELVYSQNWAKLFDVPELENLSS